jgi:hypothetical protein
MKTAANLMLSMHDELRVMVQENMNSDINSIVKVDPMNLE